MLDLLALKNNITTYKDCLEEIAMFMRRGQKKTNDGGGNLDPQTRRILAVENDDETIDKFLTNNIESIQLYAEEEDDD